jgi:hypothetical protein
MPPSIAIIDSRIEASRTSPRAEEAACRVDLSLLISATSLSYRLSKTSTTKESGSIDGLGCGLSAVAAGGFPNFAVTV